LFILGGAKDTESRKIVWNITQETRWFSAVILPGTCRDWAGACCPCSWL